MFRANLQTHPAYRDYPTSNPAFSEQIESYINKMHEYLITLESHLTFNRTSLIDGIQHFIPSIASLFRAIEKAAPNESKDFRLYLKGLWREFLRILVSDLSYFERRGSIEPIIENQTQLKQYYALESNGFL